MTRYATPTTAAEWAVRHADGYHGDYAAILARNRDSYQPRPNRLSLFSFDPADKIIVDIGCGGGWDVADCVANGASRVYGVEIDQSLIVLAERSFQELVVPPDKYRFVCAAAYELATVLPSADIIYSMAVFMHTPLAEAEEYLSLISAKLTAEGKAYLQFYQVNGRTTFNHIGNNRTETVPDVYLDQQIENVGLQLVRKDYPRNPGMEPVWTLYTCQPQKTTA